MKVAYCLLSVYGAIVQLRVWLLGGTASKTRARQLARGLPPRVLQLLGTHRKSLQSEHLAELIRCLGTQFLFALGVGHASSVYAVFRREGYVGLCTAKRLTRKSQGPVHRLLEHDDLLYWHRYGRPLNRKPLQHKGRYKPLLDGDGISLWTVSYTHLTLPTKRIV